MTFQEAQTKFSAIVESITGTMDSGALVQKQRDLIALQNSLPASAEFDVIADAIAEFSPKLTGKLTQAVLASLKSREASMTAASDLLTQVADKASADAKTLTFDDPKLVAAALSESVSQLQDLRQAAQDGDVGQVATKVDALATLIEHVRSSIKSG